MIVLNSLIILQYNLIQEAKPEHIIYPRYRPILIFSSD